MKINEPISPTGTWVNLTCSMMEARHKNFLRHHFVYTQFESKLCFWVGIRRTGNSCTCYWCGGNVLGVKLLSRSMWKHRLVSVFQNNRDVHLSCIATKMKINESSNLILGRENHCSEGKVGCEMDGLGARQFLCRWHLDQWEWKSLLHTRHIDVLTL